MWENIAAYKQETLVHNEHFIFVVSLKTLELECFKE